MIIYFKSITNIRGLCPNCASLNNVIYKYKRYKYPDYNWIIISWRDTCSYIDTVLTRMMDVMDSFYKTYINVKLIMDFS